MIHLYKLKKYIAYIFLGEQYAWGELKIGLSERAILPLKWNLLLPSVGKMMKPSDLTDLSQQLLDHLEESGHPFASVRFDSSYWNNQQLHAVLKIDAGPRYQIDSIRIDSKMHINPVFLSRYLGIQPQQLYKKVYWHRFPSVWRIWVICKSTSRGTSVCMDRDQP